MYRKIIILGLVLVASLLASPQVFSQTVVRHGGGEAGDSDILLVPELGIIVGPAEGSSDLTVIVLLPDADPALEIERDDLLLMINGERVKDMEALRAQYDSAAVGDEVKIGFRRGDRRFLSTFEKEDPETSEGGNRMVMIGGHGSEFDDMHPVHEFGVVLGQKEDQVVVAMKMPMGESDLAEGDVISSINGTEVASLEEFRGVYEALAVGDEVNVIALQDGTEIAASGTKSEFEGEMRVQRGP